MLYNAHEADRIPFLSDAISCIGDGVLITDRNGIVLYLNAAGERITGWRSAEATGLPFGEVFPLADYFSGKRQDDPVKSVLAQETTLGLPNHAALITKAGETRFVSASCSPIYSGGRVEGVVVVFRDIDRIKNTEEALRKERNNFKNVLGALTSGIALLDGNAVVLWCNQPFMSLFRSDEKALLGRRFGEGARCTGSGDGCMQGRQCLSCEIQRNVTAALREKESRRGVVIQYTFFDGEAEQCLWLNINFIPLASGGRPQLVMAVEDITKRREYELTLQRSRDAAESANRIKSEFIANISHEIRTPLNGLIGMMDLLLQTEMNAEQTEYISLAKMSGNALLKVISDILDFSSIEAGKLSIASRAFDLGALMDELIGIHKALAERKGLALHYQPADELPQFVSGDPDRLRQILNNLIGNAVKFTDVGSVTVSVRKAVLRGKKASLAFEVLDTGIGISTEKLSLLFKRFSQADGSATRRHSGTGLGLAISKQLAELMGGEIRVESTAGQGSAFVLTLPLPPAPCADELEDVAKRPEALTPSIVMGCDLPAPEGAADTAERIFLLSCPDSTEQFGRIRLGENGEFLLSPVEKPLSPEELNDALDELYRLLRQLKSITRDDRFSVIEETAHKVKDTARRLGAVELAELAFKAELSARKGNWQDAAEYCVMMVNEIHFRFKEG